MDQQSVDGLFERNADMRLLELRHRSGTRAQTTLRESTALLGAESVNAATPDAPIDAAPRLRLTIAAAPAAGIIAGASVGVAIDIFNDGGAPAPQATLVLSLPLEAQYRPGTLRIDGREPNEPERLFGTGLAIARLPGGSASKITFQLLVLAGIGALYLQPRLAAGGAPVVGAVGLSIKRRTTALAPPPEPERPFYEPDDEEERAAGESDMAILPPVLAPEPPEPEPLPRARRLVEAAVTTAAADERMTCFRSLGPSDVALLERLFAPPAPGVVAHTMLISALTCYESDDAGATAAWRTFLTRDVESLGRILVLSRLGKELQFGVTEDDLGALPLQWNAAPATPKTVAHRRLRRELRNGEFAAMTGLLQPSDRDTNLRLRIALLAVAGATIDGIGRREADEALVALASYRSAALAWLVPLCVASASPPFTLTEPPAALDAAGRRLVAVLHDAFGA